MVILLISAYETNALFKKHITFIRVCVFVFVYHMCEVPMEFRSGHWILYELELQVAAATHLGC